MDTLNGCTFPTLTNDSTSIRVSLMSSTCLGASWLWRIINGPPGSTGIGGGTDESQFLERSIENSHNIL